MYRTAGFFFIMLLGLAMLLTILYIGLNTAEQGVQQIFGLPSETRAFCFTDVKEGLMITFADHDYIFPWRVMEAKVKDYFLSFSGRYR